MYSSKGCRESRGLVRFGVASAAIAVCAFAFNGTASATVFTVNPGQSIAAAILSASFGDTISVNPGTFIGGIVVNKSVTVQANGVVNLQPSTAGTGQAIDIQCSDCAVVGFTFNDFGSGMSPDTDTRARVTIKSNTFNRNGSGFWIAGDSWLVEGNEIDGLPLSQWAEDYANVFGTNHVIRRNYFHGLRIPEDLGSSPDYKHNDCFQFWNNNGEVLHDITIEENIFTDFVQGIFLANETGVLSSMSNLTIRNNVFWGTDFIVDANLLGEPSHGAFVGKADVTGVSITNNLFYNCANNVSLYDLTSATVQGNVILNGGTAYAIDSSGNVATQSNSFVRGTIGNVLWNNGWNGYPAQGPDKYIDPQLQNVNSLVGADGVPWTADDGWRPLNVQAALYGPQIAATDPNQTQQWADLRNSFAALDTNDDSYLTLSESGLSSTAFAVADLDHDGRLSMSELLTLSLGSAGTASVVYVDVNYVGWEAGTFSQPFDTLYEAANFLAPGGTLYVKSGDTAEAVKIHGRMKIMKSGA